MIDGKKSINFFWEYFSGTIGDYGPSVSWVKLENNLSEKFEQLFIKNRYRSFNCIEEGIQFDCSDCTMIYNNQFYYLRARESKNGKNLGNGIFPFCTGFHGHSYLLVGLEKRSEGFVYAPFGGQTDRTDIDDCYAAAREAEEESLGIFNKTDLYDYLVNTKCEIFQGCFMVNLGPIVRDKRNEIIAEYNEAYVRTEGRKEIIRLKWIEINDRFRENSFRSYFRGHLEEIETNFFVMMKDPLPVFPI